RMISIMIPVEDPDQPETVLPYVSSAPTSYRRARVLLLYWQVVNTVAIPIGLIAGGALFATFPFFIRNAPEGSYIISSTEHRVFLASWFVIAAASVFMPTVWALRCAKCRELLGSGDVRGAVMAGGLCRWTLVVGALCMAALCFHTWKAFRALGPSGFAW